MAKNSENSTSKADFRLDGKIDLVLESQKGNATGHNPNS